MISVFPKDCNGCKHFISYDLSIDDYTNICKKHGWQVDDMDVYGIFSALNKRFKVDGYEDCYEIEMESKNE